VKMRFQCVTLVVLSVMCTLVINSPFGTAKVFLHIPKNTQVTDSKTKTQMEENNQPTIPLAFLAFACLKELESKLRAACGIERCISCDYDGRSDVLEPHTAAILRCAHIFCKNCISDITDLSRDGRYCPKCSEKFRSMYVISEHGSLVRWSIGGNKEKSFGREARRAREKREEKKCGIQ
jgi:hypothetical protein